MSEFEQGQVLVADMTDPDWEPIMTLGKTPPLFMEKTHQWPNFHGESDDSPVNPVLNEEI